MAIVIPVADDIRLQDCLGSINEDVEVVISMNGSTEQIKEITRKSGRRYCELPDRNLGAALDEGIKTAKSERVLLMDSDCVFDPGTINLLFHGLDDHMLAKGRVLFERTGYVSSLVAKTREYTTSAEVSAYKPPLAMRKSVADLMGGYFYDRDVHWVEDSEFDGRVRRFGIPINYLPEATIRHPPLTFFTDLRSAFRYGIGKRIGVEKGLMKGVGNFFCDECNIARNKGIDTALYMLAWNTSYTAGWLSQLMFDVYDVRERIKKGS